MLALIVPAAALFGGLFFLKRTNLAGSDVLKSFIIMNIIAICGGIGVYALISTQEFMLRLYQFRGVKLVMAGSLAAACFQLFKMDEWKLFFNMNIKIKHVGFFLAVAAAGLLLILRSGNTGPGFSFMGEQQARDFFDMVLGVRPRFKEFLFWPAAFVVGAVAVDCGRRKFQKSYVGGQVMRMRRLCCAGEHS